MNYLEDFIVTEACHLQSSTAYVPVLMNGFCLTASLFSPLVAANGKSY